VTVIVLGFITSVFFLGYIYTFLEIFVEWIKTYPITGTLLFIIVFSVGVLMMLPAMIFNICCGFLYDHITGNVYGGFLAGFIVSLLSCSLGAIGAFLIARYVFRDYFSKIA